MKHLIKNNLIVQRCNSLNLIDKWKMYIKYITAHYNLSYCHIISVSEVSKGKPDVEIESKIYNLIKGEPCSFDEFCTNIEYVSIGDTWKEQGFAQKEWLNYPFNSLYHWAIRHLNIKGI